MASDGAIASAPVTRFAVIPPPLKVKFTKLDVMDSQVYEKDWEPVFQTVRVPLMAFQSAGGSMRDGSRIRVHGSRRIVGIRVHHRGRRGRGDDHRGWRRLVALKNPDAPQHLIEHGEGPEPQGGGARRTGECRGGHQYTRGEHPSMSFFMASPPPTDLTRPSRSLRGTRAGPCVIPCALANACRPHRHRGTADRASSCR